MSIIFDKKKPGTTVVDLYNGERKGEREGGDDPVPGIN